MVELISFVVWELFHFFRVLNPILFRPEISLVLNSQTNQDFDEIYDNLKKSLLTKEMYVSPLSGISAFRMAFFVTQNEGWGCLKTNINDLIHFRLEAEKVSILHTYSFPRRIESLYVLKSGHILVCVGGKIFRSDSCGEVFEEVLVMSHLKSTFLFFTGITALPNGNLIMGEYGNIWEDKKGWMNIANLYYSKDEGKTWAKDNFLIKEGVNKHIHIIRYLSNCKTLVLTDGDNKKQLWVDEICGEKPNWRLITKFHLQMGGYTAISEVNEKVVMGTDYFGGTNFLVETEDFIHFDKKYIPNPYRKSMINAIQTIGDLVWVVATPPDFRSSRGVLLVKKITDSHWTRVIEFDKKHYDIAAVSHSLSDNPLQFIIISIIEVKSQKTQSFMLGSDRENWLNRQKCC